VPGIGDTSMNKLYKNPDQIPALSGAHSLVGAGGWAINKKEIKCAEYVACYILI
jgi:hypothetical protein